MKRRRIEEKIKQEKDEKIANFYFFHCRFKVLCALHTYGTDVTKSEDIEGRNNMKQRNGTTNPIAKQRPCYHNING